MPSTKSATSRLFAGFLLTCVLSLSARGLAQSADSSTPQSETQSPSQPAAAAPAPATAGAPLPATPARRPANVYRRHTLDERVKDLAKSLDLNETQQAGVKVALERQQLQARQIQFDQTLTGGERIGRFRALQEDTVLRIRALLNDDQKKKYDPLNHSTQPADSSQKYVDQWVKTPQHK